MNFFFFWKISTFNSEKYIWHLKPSGFKKHNFKDENFQWGENMWICLIGTESEMGSKSITLPPPMIISVDQNRTMKHYD